MRYDDPDLQDRLAAQYALGSLTGLARRRLETLMRQNPALQARVTAWEEQLAPLADTAPPIVPPGHVLTALHRRLFHDHASSQSHSARPARSAGSWWDRIAAWRWMTGAALAVAVALMAYVAVDIGIGDAPPAVSGQPSYVAVLSDESEIPGLVVTAFDKPWRLAVEPLDGLSAPDGPALQIWAVERGTGTTRPLVRIADRTPVQLPMSTEMWSMVKNAESLIVSVDDAGAETPGPTLYAGLCIQLKGSQEMRSGPGSKPEWPDHQIE